MASPAPEPSHEQIAALAATVLFENGQTTEATGFAVERLGRGSGLTLRLLATWGELAVMSSREPVGTRALAAPLLVDIGRVTAADMIVDAVISQETSLADAQARLAQLDTRPPVALLRFAVMAAAGSAGLGVIFGASDWLTLAAISASAGLGACLRRGLSHASDNPFAPPFAAALLAGVLSGACTALQLPVAHRLVAVCPCMVLVPGPHVLNGTIDLVRARIPLGAARLAFAGLIVLSICAGLLIGLSVWREGLGLPAPAATVPFAPDVVAAGIAVAAYGSFFNMPWRMLPVPMMLGMAAHAFRWMLLAAGSSVQAAAFAACLLVGIAASPLAHWLRVPFGALAFASVVSLMPGVFLFQAAAEATALIGSHTGDASSHVLGLIENGVTAFMVVAAITTGLIIPKLCMDRFLPFGTSAAEGDDRPSLQPPMPPRSR